MNEIVLHSLQSILSAGLFILIYRLFVRNTNAYNWNRCYLLTTMILSLFLPFIDISYWFTVDQPIIFYASMMNLDQAFTVMPVEQVQSTFNLSDFILTGYWLIVGFFLLRFGWGITRIIKLAWNNNYSTHGNLRLYPIQRKTTFSFFNYIFIQPAHWQTPAIDYIIRHEEAHVNQHHTIDNILTELILVFGWFNPFYYIYRNDLHLLHECQADQAVINSECDQTTYHQMLLNEVSGNLTYIIVNQFSYSLIKRRFKMISKNKQSRLAGFRILLAIPTAFALMLMFSFTSLEKTTSLLKTEILKPTIQAVQSSIDNLQTPQQKPVQKKSVKKIIKDTPPPFIKSVDTALVKKQFDANYPGGYKAWMNFFIHNFKPAPDGGFKGAQYRAYIQFVVAENGEVKSPTVINGMSKSWDSEAVRIVLMMPNWKPILKDGKPVRTQFILPIEGRLEAPKNITYVAGSQPEYKGGYDALRQYIRENTHYPESAKKLKIQGTVWVAAFINTDGKISKVELLKGIKGGCNEEALRVIKEMPDWAPGSDKTQKPICRYLTVSFNPKTIKKS